MLNPASLAARGIEAVLFDKDGTLMDSLIPWAAAERGLCDALVERRLSAERRGEQVSRMLADLGIVSGAVDRRGLLATGTSAAIMEALRRSLETAAGSRVDPEAFSSEVAEILRRLYPAGGPEVAPMVGADRLLSALRAEGFTLGLSTSDDYSRTMAELDRFGWRRHFAFIACGDTAREPKPSPWSVREFSRVASVPCSSIAVVGDTDTDRAMAKAAGAGLFILVTDGFDVLD